MLEKVDKHTPLDIQSGNKTTVNCNTI